MTSTLKAGFLFHIPSLEKVLFAAGIIFLVNSPVKRESKKLRNKLLAQS